MLTPRPFLISVKVGALAWLVLVAMGAGRLAAVATAWAVFLLGGWLLNAVTRADRTA